MNEINITVTYSEKGHRGELNCNSVFAGEKIEFTVSFA